MLVEQLREQAPAISETDQLARWFQWLPRPAAQLNAFNESDAEFMPLGGGKILAATVDTVEEEIRWGLYRDPCTAGRVAVLATLSDLAAVGATPLGLLLSVGLPAKDVEDVQRAVALGAAEACKRGAVAVLGGDTNDTATLSVGCVGLGLVPDGQQITRRGARPGDHVFATGPLGDGAAFAAARVLDAPALFDESEFFPAVRLRHGEALRGIASACMDTSDGLIATLDQLSRVNDVGIRLAAPLERLLSLRAKGVSTDLAVPPLALLAAIHGEFELVFTVPERRLHHLRRVASAMDWQPLPVGMVVADCGVSLDGRPIDTAYLRNLGRNGALAEYAQQLLEACR